MVGRPPSMRCQGSPTVSQKGQAGWRTSLPLWYEYGLALGKRRPPVHPDIALLWLEQVALEPSREALKATAQVPAAPAARVFRRDDIMLALVARITMVGAGMSKSTTGRERDNLPCEHISSLCYRCGRTTQAWTSSRERTRARVASTHVGATFFAKTQRSGLGLLARLGIWPSDPARSPK